MGSWDFSLTLSLGSTQSLTKMSTKSISLGGGGVAVGQYIGLTNLPTLCAVCLRNSGSLTLLMP